MTTSAVDLCGTGIPDKAAVLLGNTFRTIAGVGTAQSGAASLRPAANQSLLTTTGGQTAFVLSTEWAVGQEATVYNTSATAALVFPQLGGAIDGGSTNASVPIDQNTARTFIKVTATAWRTQSDVSAGGSSTFTAITVNDITAGDASLGVAGIAGTQGGAIAMVGGASSTSANAGGAVTVTGGAPGATGVGGAVTIAGAPGGATSGTGGAANVTAGAGTAGNANGGSVVLTAGAANGSGRAGGIRQEGRGLFQQSAPAALTTTATLTGAQVAGGLVTANQGAGAGATYTFPIGSDLEAALPADIATGDSFMFRVTNISTVAAEDATFQGGSGTTLLGSGVVASNAAATDISCASFLVRRTGTNTYSIYRVG